MIDILTLDNTQFQQYLIYIYIYIYIGLNLYISHMTRYQTLFKLVTNIHNVWMNLYTTLLQHHQQQHIQIIKENKTKQGVATGIPN